jgi:carbamate kinase
MQEELSNIGVDASSATIITQVEVAKNDPAFSNPSKPIGPFYESLEEAKEKSGSNNTYIEDSGRGWRRVVPSPRPIRIIEIETIKKMMNAGVLVITAGGGGVPVIVDDNKITGIEAVIDKDHAASLLAEQLDAEKLIILTSVSGVSINYGKPDEKLIESATVEEMKKYVRDGYFAAGSMLPKVLAAIKFVESGPNRETIIASLDDASAALNGQSGTRITLH